MKPYMSNTSTQRGIPINNTKRRILIAAGQQFSEHGYTGASIRGICQRSGTNVSSVNYHFRDKKNLYRRAIYYACSRILRAYRKEFKIVAESSPEQRLQAFICNFIRCLSNENGLNWKVRLLARNMIDPDGIIDATLIAFFRSEKYVIEKIVRDVVGESADGRLVHMAILNIIGQCFGCFYLLPFERRIWGQGVSQQISWEQMVEHIAQFSLVGLRHLASVQRLHQ
jgi:TetR/AcrR family transcriptional regulator, regulator of cefoperazone and chloramphenicol sensitivity